MGKISIFQTDFLNISAVFHIVTRQDECHFINFIYCVCLAPSNFEIPSNEIVKRYHRIDLIPLWQDPEGVNKLGTYVDKQVLLLT